MTTCLTDDRESALRVGYDVIKGDPVMEGVSYEQYERNFSPWRIRAIERDGTCIGVVYTLHGEIHVAVLPEYHGRWVSRSLLRQMFDMPKVIAYPIKPHEKMYGYLLRLGFVSAGGDTLIME